jgi:NAD(P)-dependent dehydrogenase (short-subunit alcohol dehydrogenase family)
VAHTHRVRLADVEMLREAIRFEAGHFGVQVTIVQPGTIHTEMTEREQKFELPEWLCCIWSTGVCRSRCRSRDQIAKESSSNATATRRASGSSTASS